MIYGSKGEAATFQQTPDNLRSVDTFEGVLGMGIGPMKGPTNGLKSIKLDGTPIEDESGQMNFGDFVATIGDGDPAKFPQTINLKLGGGASPEAIGLTLTNPNNPDGSSPTGPGPWVTKTLTNTAANFIDFRFIVQSLYRQDKNGIYAEGLTIEIEMKPTGTTTWINPTLVTPTGSYDPNGLTYDNLKLLVPQSYYDASGDWIQQSPNFYVFGKTTSAAVYELRVGVPNDGNYSNVGWDVRARLVERETYSGGDNNVDQEKRTVSWESIAAVYGSTMGTQDDWRGLAWLQLYGQASDQLSGVPEITGEWDTKIVSVPPSTLFNPDARSYASGIWDGSWAKAYCNDPAWVVNDAISDELSGLSLIASGSYLNKWDALEASKWFSQPVPDGNGGLEPRYSLNLAVTDPQKAEDFIRYLSGAVGALTWDQGDGEWRMKCDKPDNPVDIFTLENVQGEFVYSHTDVDTRFNAVIGQFLNSEMDYRPDAVTIYENDSIALIGRKPTTIALVGCTGRQEALRRVKLRVRTAVNENKIVSFTTNRRGRNVEQLSMILIADGDLGDIDQRTTGRVVSVSSDRKTLTVRDTLRLEVGVAYTLKFALPNAAYAPETLTQPTSADWTKPTVVGAISVTNTPGQVGNVKILHLASALPTGTVDDLVVALEASTLPTLPRLYRVTSVVPQDDGELIAISAISVDTGKWDAADNVTNQDTVFQDLRGPVPMPLSPDSGNVLSLYPAPSLQGKSLVIGVSWVRPAGAFISGFRIEYKVNGGAVQTPVPRTQDNSFDLVNPSPGTYEFSIYTLDRRGGVSKPLVASIEVTQAILDANDITYGDGTAIEDLQPAEAGAQVTRTMSLSSTTVTFVMDATNTLIAGQLPYTVQPLVLAGLVPATQLADFSVSTSGGVTCTIDNDPTHVVRGQVTITGVTGPGLIYIKATIDGVALQSTFRIETKGILADKASVDTLEIAPDAVSGSNSIATSTVYFGGTTYTVLDFNIPLAVDSRIILILTAAQGYDNGDSKAWTINVYGNSTLLTKASGGVFGSDAPSTSGYFDAAGGTTANVQVTWGGQDGHITLQKCSVVYLVLKR